MPIYEYVCESCGHATEIMQRMSEPPATECPACHAPALVKQMSAAGFRLKGGGWYETDFKSDGKRNVAGDTDAPAPAAADAAKAGTAKSDGAAGDAKSGSKPDSKTESKPASVESKSPSPSAGASGCATPTSSAANPSAT